VNKVFHKCSHGAYATSSMLSMVYGSE
jgi:hypothetical protein